MASVSTFQVAARGRSPHLLRTASDKSDRTPERWQAPAVRGRWLLLRLVSFVSKYVVIVPKFWAEGRIQKKLPDGRQVTVRRFGWSDVDVEDAQRLADERTLAAMKSFERGETVERREWKVPYNGADGVPIREEVLESGEGWVITRNSYGAKCINTPDVMFADIDFELFERSVEMTVAQSLICVCAGIFTGWYFHSLLYGASALGLYLFLFSAFLQWRKNAFIKKSGGVEKMAIARVEDFLRKNGEWNIRLYRTPLGLRLLVTHTEFDPSSDVSSQFLKAIEADPVYIRMCDLQKCYRARLTGKPWRMGISDHLKPRPGVWPIKEEHMQRREQWMAKYDQKSTQYAACKFLKELGSGVVTAKVQSITHLHDEVSKAHSSLPLA